MLSAISMFEREFRALLDDGIVIESLEAEGNGVLPREVAQIQV